MPAKRYFYVDESGQDTKGQFFIVAIVISEQDADDLRMACLEIERLSRKGTRKWIARALIGVWSTSTWCCKSRRLPGA